MSSLLRLWDRLAAWIAREACTLGQLALVCLGVHLAGDRLDDLAIDAITAAGDRLAPLLDGLLGIEELDPAVPSVWLALIAELAADAIFAWSLLFTDRTALPSWRAWRRVRTVESVVLPVSLAGVLLAGAWSLSMGMEDLLPASPAARIGAGSFALAALGRFGWPAWARSVAHLEHGDRWTEGLARALLLAPVGWLAWSHGVPFWGFFP